MVRIRQARRDEGALLTGLAFRSKAFWGYDSAFLERAKSDLEFRSAKFEPDFHVYVIEASGDAAGFYSLIPLDSDSIELHDLFVDPRQIGKGFGTELWQHAVGLSKRLGFKRLVLTADPNAEPFYLHCGAVRTGEKVSPVDARRRLPIMEFSL